MKKSLGQSKESLMLKKHYFYFCYKKEEASINYAVVKPSIKIIDRAMSNSKPVSPTRGFIYFTAFYLVLLLPFL